MGKKTVRMFYEAKTLEVLVWWQQNNLLSFGSHIMQSLKLEICDMIKGYPSVLGSWSLHKIAKRKDIIPVLTEWSHIEEHYYSSQNYQLPLLKAAGEMTRHIDKFVRGG